MRFRRRDGFSLVELFVVIVVIGVLVGLAIPRFRSFRRKFYITTMTSDLQNLALSEEAYWSEWSRYSEDLRALDFTPSSDVKVTVVSADSTGWSATASHGADDARCAMFYGTAPEVPPATVKNIIGCTR